MHCSKVKRRETPSGAHASLGQTVSIPYDLWLKKTPGQLEWGNHMKVRFALKKKFKTRVRVVDLKTMPGYYVLTSLSGHFPEVRPSEERSHNLATPSLVTKIPAITLIPFCDSLRSSQVHLPVCNFEELFVNPEIKDLLIINVESIPRLSAEEFNQNYFVSIGHKGTVKRKPGTWWRR